MTNGELAAALLSTAAFSGLLGAVAQPVVTHLLAGRQQRRSEQRQANRELRSMVNAELRYGRQLFAALAIVQLWGVGVARMARSSIVPSRILWRPERIRDTTAATAALKYAEVCAEMHLALTAAEAAGMQLPLDMLKGFVDRFMALEKQLTIRMDDLQWRRRVSREESNMAEQTASPRFANMLSRAYVQKITQKRLIGKPYTTMFNMFGIGGFLFQKAAILSNVFRANPHDFIFAFAGGKESASDYILAETRENILPHLDDAADITELLVNKERAGRISDAGEADTFFLRRGGEKVPPDVAFQFAMEWSISGVGVGLLRPDRFRQLYDRMHTPTDPARWTFWHDHGLDISATQDVILYEDQEREDVHIFLEYCAEFHPQLALAPHQGGG